VPAGQSGPAYKRFSLDVFTFGIQRGEAKRLRDASYIAMPEANTTAAAVHAVKTSSYPEARLHGFAE
jgi:hypothetical protein